MDDEIDTETGLVVHRYPACLIPSADCSARRIQPTKVDGKTVGRHLAICEHCAKEHDMKEDERLWGTPGAEYMQSDAAAAYETEIDPWVDEEDRRPRVLEEWTVESDEDILRRVRDADTIIDSIHEAFCDDYGAETDPLEGIEKDPEALAAAEALRRVIAKKATGWRWAKEKIADHLITWDAAGEPLLDGEPLYVPVPTDGN